MLRKLLLWAVLSSFINLAACNEEPLTLRSQDVALVGYVELINHGNYRSISTGATNAKFNSELNWVSIAKHDRNNYVIANYSSLMIFDRSESSICPLQILGGEFVSAYDGAEGGSLPEKKKKIFNPTGVFIDQEGMLYLANYKGNNILSFSLDVTKCSATLVDEYTSKQSGGPENVVVDNNKSVLVSANYDAGTVTAFSLKTKKQLWSTSVSQAHGVTISKGVVYATGLTERKIYEINLDTGTIIRSAGELGWDPLKGQFLWPTSIFADGDSSLILSDAHSGFVSKIGKKSLAATYYFGGNGPSYKRFNYPYVAAVFGDEMFVLSSMRNQLLILDKHSLAIKEGFTTKPDYWLPDHAFSYDFKRGWVGYVNHSESEILNIAGRDYMYGYGHLHPMLPGPVLRVPDAGTLLNPTSYLYFLMGVDREWGSVYFSPSGQSLVSIIRGNNLPDLVYRTFLPVDSWVVNRNIYLGDGSALDESSIEKGARRLRKAADAIYKKYGWMSVDSYLDLMNFSRDYFQIGDANPTTGREKASELLAKVFVSRYGHDFFQLINSCKYNRCNTKTISTAASKYFEFASKESYVNFDEYMLVSMFSGLRPPADKIKNYHGTMKYSDCGNGKYYPGFGVNALESKGYEDYLSAIDLKSSVVCFQSSMTPHGAKQLSLQIGWLNFDEIPGSFEVLELGSDGKPLLIKKIIKPEVLTSGGLPYSLVTLEESKRGNMLMLKINEGGAQNRLLLRSLFLN